MQREEEGVVKEEPAQSQLQGLGEAGEEAVEEEVGEGVGVGAVVAWVALPDHFALAKEKTQIAFENRGMVSPAGCHVHIKYPKNKTPKRTGIFFKD